MSLTWPDSVFGQEPTFEPRMQRLLQALGAQPGPLCAEARSLVISICLDINGNVAPPGIAPSADAAKVKAVLSAQ